jgi:YVTN family beta-propeller protein
VIKTNFKNDRGHGHHFEGDREDEESNRRHDESIIDKANKHIEVGTEPYGLVLTPNGKKLYVSNSRSDSISVIDTQTDKVVRTIKNVDFEPVAWPSPTTVTTMTVMKLARYTISLARWLARLMDRTTRRRRL